jgi:hypothetical protein
VISTFVKKFNITSFIRAQAYNWKQNKKQLINSHTSVFPHILEHKIKTAKSIAVYISSSPFFIPNNFFLWQTPFLFHWLTCVMMQLHFLVVTSNGLNIGTVSQGTFPRYLHQTLDLCERVSETQQLSHSCTYRHKLNYWGNLNCIFRLYRHMKFCSNCVIYGHFSPSTQFFFYNFYTEKFQNNFKKRGDNIWKYNWKTIT